MTCSFSSDSEMKWTYQKHETNSCTRHKAREVKSLLLIGSERKWRQIPANPYSAMQNGKLMFSIIIQRVLRCVGSLFKAEGKHPGIYWKHNRTRVVFHGKAFEKQWFLKTTERILNAFEYVVLVHVCFTCGVFFLLHRISLYPSSHGCWPAGKWDD